jgi:uncharacterized membrane protein YjfL (UPF0719 family)
MEHGTPQKMLKNILRDPVFWKAALVTVLFFLFIFSYVREFDHFNLTIKARSLVIPALIIGGTLGLGLGLYLQRRYQDAVVRLQIVMACMFGLLIVSPLFASLSNRLLSWKKVKYEEVEFVREQAYYSSRFGAIRGESQMPTGYYLFFYYEGRLIRLSLDNSFFKTTEEGEQILIPVKRGLWGIDFIKPSLINNKLKSIES